MNRKINFSLTQLEYALAVHKFGHFAKAAEHCLVTQPTLSMQVQKLEESLGAVIFDRSKKPILLTNIGSLLLEQIQLVVSEAKKIEGIIEYETSEVLTGLLILGVIPTIAPYLLPLLLPTLERLFPGIQLQIREMQTHQIIDALNGDEIHVGLLAIPILDPKLTERSLFVEPFVVLSSKNSELPVSKKIKYNELPKDNLWLLEEGHCLRNQVLDVCKQRENVRQKQRYKFESGNLETLKNLINSYGGYTLLPWLAKKNLGPNAKLAEFEKPIPAREVGLIYRREHYKIELINALMSSILQSIPAELRKFKPKMIEVLPVS